MHRGRRRVAAMTAAFALSASGTTAITVAMATEQPPPQPPHAATAVPPAPAPRVPAPPEPADPDATAALPPSNPVAIEVPAIGVHSALHQVGLTAEHTMEVPAGPHYNEAAWYQHSSSPGAHGPAAVIVGHVDSAAQGPSVFFDLGDLGQGDEVLVTRADGLVAVFRVDEVGRYPKDAFPTALVYDDTGHAALRLITCGGVFDRAAGRYLDNIVVFATLVGTR